VRGLCRLWVRDDDRFTREPSVTTSAFGPMLRRTLTCARAGYVGAKVGHRQSPQSEKPRPKCLGFLLWGTGDDNRFTREPSVTISLQADYGAG
jgi:hypothetical protein